jgi:hypothetical protein
MSIAISQLTSRIRSVNATDAAPIHWPSALIGLALAVFVVVGVSWLAAPRRADLALVASSSAASASAPAQAAPAVAPTPIPAPVVTPEPPAPDRVKVSFTNGSGVNFRARAGERGQRLKTVPEGTILEVIGGEETVDGIVWRNVRDASGASGWMASKFLAKLQ